MKIAPVNLDLLSKYLSDLQIFESNKFVLKSIFHKRNLYTFAASFAEYTKLSKKEQAMYNQDLKRKWDNEAAHLNSIEEGMAKGEYKKALEIAAEMKKKNFPEQIIAEMTKLSIDEIKNL